MSLNVDLLLRQVTILTRSVKAQDEKINYLKAKHKEELRKSKVEQNKMKFVINNGVRGNSISSANKLRKKIKDVFTVINGDLIKVGYSLDTILSIRKNTNQNISVNSFELNFIEDSSNSNIVEKSLYFKDKASIPDNKYHIFRKGMQLGKKISSLYKVKRLRKEKGAKMGIKPLGKGYYLDPVKLIKEKIGRFLNSLGEGETLDLIKIKLACDGTMSYESTKSWLPALWAKIKELKKNHIPGPAYYNAAENDRKFFYNYNIDNKWI